MWSFRVYFSHQKVQTYPSHPLRSVVTPSVGPDTREPDSCGAGRGRDEPHWRTHTCVNGWIDGYADMWVSTWRAFTELKRTAITQLICVKPSHHYMLHVSMDRGWMGSHSLKFGHRVLKLCEAKVLWHLRHPDPGQHGRTTHKVDITPTYLAYRASFTHLSTQSTTLEY